MFCWFLGPENYKIGYAHTTTSLPGWSPEKKPLSETPMAYVDNSMNNYVYVYHAASVYSKHYGHTTYAGARAWSENR